MKVKNESEVTQSCLTLSNPMDCNPPGSSIHGIFQARALEWGAIALSELKPYCVLDFKTGTVKGKESVKMCQDFLLQQGTQKKCIPYG